MISVIVPVYNCENYLDRSIQSLIEQTIFNELEIIFINDGSTDRSESILEKYIEKHNNMHLFQQENLGVSAARNLGIKKSHGQYVAFFDADDIAKAELYEKLLKLIQTNEADISIVDYSMLFEDGAEVKHRNSDTYVWEDMESALMDFFKNNVICTNPVDKLFSADLVKKICFPEGYAIGEDMFFVYCAIKKASRIVIDSTESLYLYCIRSDSAMKSSFSRKHMDSVKLSKLIMEDFSPKDTLFNYAESNYIHEICKMLGLLYREDNKSEYMTEVSAYIVTLKKYSIFKAFKYMSKKHLCALMLMKWFPHLYPIVYNALKIG